MYVDEHFSDEQIINYISKKHNIDIVIINDYIKIYGKIPYELVIVKDFTVITIIDNGIYDKLNILHRKHKLQKIIYKQKDK